MKIIHIINEVKFSKMAAKAFDAVYPDANYYVSFSREKLNFNVLKFTHYPRFFVFFKVLIKYLLKADVVVFHSIGPKELLLLRAISKKTKVIWIGWGYDYYDIINVQLLKQETLKLLSSSENKENFGGVVLDFFLFEIKKRKSKWINRVDIFSPVIFEDFKLVKKELPEMKAKYVSWNYGTLEDDHIRGFEDKKINGSNILLGNSASDTNNHLDAFEYINNLNFDGRKVIVPLSYGDIEYRDIIIREGNKLFPRNFLPLTDFMPIDEYTTILQSCSIVIMNHLRQQALGNIVIALYMGAKVFLDERNPIYDFFIEQGAFIYKLEQLEMEFEDKLLIEQVMHNREVLKSYWSRDVILDKTKKIVETALNL
ncbi:TDP-N-acetylfucosamine:lipid II N-acetylfucosaminyltransferase [Thiopseudomonas alkaliphila]|uniref:TDP-N-acetylfucosamine:lipid II N-acetylfucosaminyltransferase n=1 Tax=Thiopseudomonas alkaliphila TaxID=1697053 RepID=UPI003570D276